ncbi:MAG: ferredoxin [Actinomycetota bacterium]|jgi:ferredoxin|nr:ferredoxin [Actinomycetota bacterium]
MGAPDRTSTRLRVDPVACDGVGMCAHLAAGLVRLDSWGYPIVAERDLDAREQRRAGQAVAGCPRRALFLDRRDG